jgi:hypothetical protein
MIELLALIFCQLFRRQLFQLRHCIIERAKARADMLIFLRRDCGSAATRWRRDAFEHAAGALRFFIFFITLITFADIFTTPADTAAIDCATPPLYFHATDAFDADACRLPSRHCRLFRHMFSLFLRFISCRFMLLALPLARLSAPLFRPDADADSHTLSTLFSPPAPMPFSFIFIDIFAAAHDIAASAAPLSFQLPLAY